MFNIDEEQKTQIAFARAFFPWANKPLVVNVNEGGRWIKKEIAGPMTDEEILGVMMRCQAWRLNPADRHQVNIWRDKHGIYVEPAYTILKNWLDHRGRHSPVVYKRLMGERMEEEGAKNGDIVFEASCYYYNDLGAVAQLRALGIPAQEALNTITIRGVGIVTAKDVNKKYAASNGRAIGDKAKKRAFVDLASEIGSPTDAEFRDMAGMNRGVLTSDYDDTGMLALEDAQHLAQAHANERSPLLDATQRGDAASALFGGGDMIDGEMTPPTPEPEYRDRRKRIIPEGRPQTADEIRESLLAFAGTFPNKAPTKGRVWQFIKQIESCFDGKGAEKTAERHLATWWLFGVIDGSSKKLSGPHVRAWLNTYMQPRKTEDDPFVLQPYARPEMQKCATVALKAAEQASLEESAPAEDADLWEQEEGC